MQLAKLLYFRATQPSDLTGMKAGSGMMCAVHDSVFLAVFIDFAAAGFQISYMISAWARMCKIMGKDFEQYLPLVMGPVLKAAALKPEVALLDSMYL